MTSIFGEDGRVLSVTVIEAGPCFVVQRKTVATDGYEAVALGFGDVKRGRLTRAVLGHFARAGVSPARRIREFRRNVDGVEQGAVIRVDEFAVGERVDVVGISKGHGFAGGIKRHHFSGGGASHGSMIHRQPASNGDTNSGHTHRGSRRPGHFGVDRTTHQNLKIAQIDVERNLLFLQGPVPGPRDAFVEISLSVKSKPVAA